MRRGSAWVVLVAALAGSGATAALGLWQLGRAATKEALHQRIVQRGALPVLGAADLPSGAAAVDALVERRVALAGRWLSGATVFLDNRQMNGRPGFYVVTPLQLADGSAVLVQRGWVPRDGRDRTRVPDVAPTTAQATVQGRLAASPSRLYDFAGAASGPIRQNLDLAAYGAEIGVALRPFAVLQQGAAVDAATALLRDWPEPQSGVHKHYGYALQWFLLSALIAGLYVWFRIIVPRRTPPRAG